MKYGKETQVVLITFAISCFLFVGLTFLFNKYKLKEDPTKQATQPSIDVIKTEYNSKLLELSYEIDEFDIKRTLEGDTEEIKQIYVQLVMKHKELQKLAERYNIMVESSKDKITVPQLSVMRYSGKNDLIN